MNKSVMWALLLIGLTVIVLLFNVRDDATVNLIFTKTRHMAALVYLFFIGLGVIIGILLK